LTEDILCQGTLRGLPALGRPRLDICVEVSWTTRRLAKAVCQTDTIEVLDATAFIRRLAVANCVPQSAAVVRTSVQKQLGAYLSELPHAGDLEMWVRFALHSKVAQLKERQVAYHWHGSNMSSAYSAAADFEQCRNAFRMHYREIRDRLHDGAALELWIRQRYALMALVRAKSTWEEGEWDTCRRLLMDALDEVPEHTSGLNNINIFSIPTKDAT
jgi:hypothetical protein